MYNHLHIVSTLDGRLVAFNRKTGEKVWTANEYLGTMINVEEFTNPLDQKKGVFIPEIGSGIGRLYYYSNEGITQTKIPLKKIINDHSVFVDDQFVFTGKKVSSLLKIDAETGALLNVYGEDNVSQKQINESNDVIYFSKTSYILLIYDKESSALRWNISYGEFGVALSSDGFDNSDLIAQMNSQSRSLIDPKIILENTASPFMASFDAVIDRNGKRQLIKSFSFKETDAAYIGEMDGSLYIIPTSKGIQPRMEEKGKDLILASCEVGSPLFPDCMLGVHSGKELIERDKISPKVDVVWFLFTFFVGLVILVLIVLRFTRNKKESDSSNPRSIKVSDTILGVGSHGTVVYSGSFEGRRVAVKRLLREFYDLADSEVKLLQESDSHPNVVRYFFKEECHQFTYLALELCPASLYDIVEKQDSNDHLAAAWQSVDHRDAIHQILSGLQHLHNLNIVHRDIKPQVRLFIMVDFY